MGGAIVVFENSTLAQIIADDTLGSENSVVRSNIDINSVPSDQIDGGAIRGVNLFHSFGQFNVAEGRGAYFTNPAGIQNILSRVTGSDPSNILGKLGVLGNANLFLINPNGIIFGPSSSLDVGGSFVGTTASSINFADGTHFSATAPQSMPLLNVSVPIGLQFGANPGRILVQGDGQGLRSTTALVDTSVGLRVQPNQTLALVGGDIALEGGTLKTAGGRIELGSVAGPSVVSLSPTEKGWIFGYESVLTNPSGQLSTYKDIHLSNAAAVDASGVGGGNIQVWGKRVRLTNGSQIETSTLGIEPGGTLSVIASESVELIGGSADGQYFSGLVALVYEGAAGAGGNLTVETGRLVVQDGALMLIGTYSEGAAGTLTISARESVEVIGTLVDSVNLSSALFSTVQRGATGAGGNLILETGRLIVRDGAQIAAGTLGAGRAGTLTILARESVELSGTSIDNQAISLLTSETDGIGDAGDLTIETGQLTVQNGAEISGRSTGQGKAGNIQVRARNFLLDQGNITATTESGNGGNIILQIQDLLLLRRESNISTTAGTSEVAGNGGNITIDTDILVGLENSDIIANAFQGQGGRVEITAQGIFGTQARVQQSLQTSDITASSTGGPDLSGSVEINSPDVNPSRGLVSLPTVATETEIVQACQPSGSQEQSEFVVTGRGGLPPAPSNPLNSDALWIDLDSTPGLAENTPSTWLKAAGVLPARPLSRAATYHMTNSTVQPLVEATGWVIDDKGEVVLIASATTATPDNLGLNRRCYVR